MTDQLPWNFEPADPDGALDAGHVPWEHAVRGRREGGRLVMGYGHTPRYADEDARERAQQFDAREVLGLPQVSAVETHPIFPCSPMPSDPRELALLHDMLVEWWRTPQKIQRPEDI